ncbi:MAG TPA: tripartite tricarboxylate transporter substrate binding protein [Xanthobacteraceae bacterium]|jgi:tripartite-type tricarboxylate transporter receptor subunit TctC|nr:tripartite tricarboxylate transporter substrate binding protein [Xanthobacteraceae bacterium]
MNLPRRALLRAAAGAAAAFAVGSRIARAEDYPTRPVHIAVGFPPGTSSDITARLTAQWLSERLGQQFIVENRPGAGTNIAAESVAHAAPDGYALLWVTQSNAINQTLYQSLNFDFAHDIRPVAGIVRVPAVMIVTPSLPPKSVAEFVAYAKANPGKINMASPGIGSANHVFGELFKMMTGTDLVHVPYRDAWFADLFSGQTQVTFNPMPASLGFIKSGKVRALAVTSATRQDVLPDVPTIAESVPGYEATAWFGIGVPKDTPTGIVDKLSSNIDACLADAKNKARLNELGGVEFSGSPGQFADFITAETAKWARVIKFAGVRPE